MHKTKNKKQKLTFKNLFLVTAFLSLLVITLTGLVSADITGSETMSRSSSVSTITPGSTFTITYAAIGASSPWGASIQDAVSGGCTFPSGSSSYKTVMLSEDGTTKSITMTAPSSAGTCTFTGDYQYGTSSIKTFSSTSVTISAGSSSCTPDCSGKVCGSNGCGGVCGTCDTNQICSNSQCVSNGDGTTMGSICWQQGSDLISKITNSSDCQTNTLILIAVIVAAFVLIIAIIK